VRGAAAGSSWRYWSRHPRRLDQFIVRNPDYFLATLRNTLSIQPDNLEILVNHLKCAAFELPIGPQEEFGDVDVQEPLCAAGGGGFSCTRPARIITGRRGLSRGHGEPAIGDQRQLRDHRHHRRANGNRRGGFSSALTTVHEKAIYIHGGQQYHVEHLDFKERKAYVKRVDVDYYTDAIRYTQVRILECAEDRNARGRSAFDDSGHTVHMATCWCGRRLSDSRRSSFHLPELMYHAGPFLMVRQTLKL